MEGTQNVERLLKRIYGEEKGQAGFARILPLIEAFPKQTKKRSSFFSEKDIILITYGDTLRRPGEAPLKTFHSFTGTHLKEIVSCIHFLPFFPFSSDDGFSVMDFFSIDPLLGSWDDLNPIGKDFRLMFDYVVNHFSSKGKWFENYLKGRRGFEDFAISVDPSLDLSKVTRPRSLPLLTEYRKHDGERVSLWTTFSEDQIDFNFKSLDVLDKMVEVLLFYTARGAEIVRLDAIAYLWKEIGSNCVHLPRTHDMVKLFRSILDLTAPDVVILTETNVPHAENISYFGDGGDEAQMVYNFTLPPLLLHAFTKQDVTLFSEWAKTLTLDSADTTFFNFTASHDGIGVRPLEGILPESEIEDLVELVKANGGQVSYKRNPDGSDSPYELNITYVDAILAGETALAPQKFLASQSIQYALPGVPASYIHSLLGSRNWLDGVAETGRARTVNREKLNVEDLLPQLQDPESLRSEIFSGYRRLMEIRRGQPAFHPKAGFEILDAGTRVFAIRRHCDEQEIVAFTNITPRPQTVSLQGEDTGIYGKDLLTGKEMAGGPIELQPYQVLWVEY